MENMDIKTEIYSSGIRFWEVAKRLGYAPETFSRKLRYELNAEDKEKIRSILEELTVEREKLSRK